MCDPGAPARAGVQPIPRHAQVASAPLPQVLPGTSSPAASRLRTLRTGFPPAPEAQLGPAWGYLLACASASQNDCSVR